MDKLHPKNYQNINKIHIMIWLLNEFSNKFIINFEIDKVLDMKILFGLYFLKKISVVNSLLIFGLI